MLLREKMYLAGLSISFGFDVGFLGGYAKASLRFEQNMVATCHGFGERSKADNTAITTYQSAGKPAILTSDEGYNAISLDEQKIAFPEMRVLSRRNQRMPDIYPAFVFCSTPRL